MKTRLYTVRTPIIEEALKAAEEAELVEGKVTDARKARAWIEYGYRRWREDRERKAKIRAYEEIGADDEHLEAVREASRRAAEAGAL